MIKVIEEKTVPTAQVRCENCGSLLEFGNADLWDELNTANYAYPMLYRYYIICPVCKYKIYVERIRTIGTAEHIQEALNIIDKKGE